MDFVWFVFSIITSTILLVLQAWRLLLYFQQEEYSVSRFLKWAGKSFLFVNLYVLPLIIALFVGILFADSSSKWIVFGRILASLLAGGWVYFYISQPKKIKLVYTPRLKRLIVTIILITVGVGFTFGFLTSDRLVVILILDVVLNLLVPVIIVLANLFLSPVEKKINNYYLRLAHEKIKYVSPLVVGITGSYGKTSTKEILAHILEGYKSVLATPKSYNTLLGVTKVINTSLQKGHEVFIVEMGAYRPGEIADICELVKPTFGVITAIGPQHLERFKTIDNVARAKFELMAALPKTGVAVFNADDKYTKDFLSKIPCEEHFLVSIADCPQAELLASNIKASEKGMAFLVENKLSGESATFTTELLGYHNVLNILFASSIALRLGMKLRNIADKVSNLRPVTHRLQLIKLPNGVNVIDDAYNSNPVGAKSALDTLRLFSGRKIVVTPGFVELGEIQEDENYKLGLYASKICDMVVLVGEGQTASIFKGLIESNFEDQKIKVVNSVKEGVEYINSFVQSSDTVLYLNDLPDVYTDKL
jgi:UDP-N-acetylmuramoyl-tripeptide--D-alanyl-D-alanine ligase